MLTRKDFLCTLMRYKYYVDAVPTDTISPYNKQWLDNTRLLVGEAVLAASDKRIVKTLQDEVLEEYYTAVKKAVCNYCFLDEATRQRTAVLIYPELVDPWGDWRYMKFPLEIGASFGIDEETGRTLLSEWEELERMQLLDVFVGNTQASRELLEMFHQDYEQLVFVDLPKKV